jgi:hypothetical protein
VGGIHWKKGSFAEGRNMKRKYYVQQYEEITQAILDLFDEKDVSVKQAKRALRNVRRHINGAICRNPGIKNFDPTCLPFASETTTPAAEKSISLPAAVPSNDRP